MALSKEIHCRTRIVVEECKFTWAIENFSVCALKGLKILTSSIFTTGESLQTKWQFELHLNDNEYIGFNLTQLSSESNAHNFAFSFGLIVRRNEKVVRIRKGEHNHSFEDSKSWENPKAFLRKALLDLPSLLLPKDTLTVYCELRESFDKVENVATSEVTQEPKTSDIATSDVFKDINSLALDLQCLYENGMCSDFIIKVGDGELKVHRSILCARSSVFNTMLNCDMKEKLTSCVEITDYDPPVVKTMLEYIYYGQVQDLKPETSTHIYSIADKYNIQGLKNICAKYLLRNLNIDSICDALILGELHNEVVLLEASKAFFCENVAAIQETEQWIKLSETIPALALSMYRLASSKKKLNNSRIVVLIF